MTEKTIDRPGPGVRSAVDVANERSFLQWAGWSGLVGTLAFVTTIVAAQVSAVADPEGPGEILGYLEEVSQSGWNTYTYGIAGIVLTVLYIPMAVGVYRLLARSTAAWYGSASVVIGLAVLFPAYVINLLVPAGLVPLAADMGGVGAEALYADYAFARAAAEVFFTVGSLLSLGFGPLLWGYDWLRSFESRRWLGWAGIITGVTGMIWFVWLINSPLVSMVLIANVVLSLVFFTGASLSLVSEGRRGR